MHFEGDLLRRDLGASVRDIVRLGIRDFTEHLDDPKREVTFFDPAGTELPTQAATMAVVPAAGDAAVPAARLLEPGHFVATFDAVAGDVTVDVVSPLPAPATGQVHVHVTIEVAP